MASKAQATLDEIIALLGHADLGGDHATPIERIKDLIDNLHAQDVVLKDQRAKLNDATFDSAAPEIENEPDKLHRIYAEGTVAYGQIATPMIDGVMQIVTKLAKPWSKLQEYQQQDLISQISGRIRSQLQVGLRVMVAADHPKLSAKLVDFTTKGSIIKVKLETVKSEENLLALGRIGEGQLDVVFTDIKAIDDGSASLTVKPTKDQGDVEDLLTPVDDTPPFGNDADLNNGVQEPSFLDSQRVVDEDAHIDDTPVDDNQEN